MKKNKGGRPSKYDTIDLKQLGKLAELGLTDKQMAYAIGISEDTFNTYKEKQEFSESLKRGKAISDNRVEESLFNRAIGYTHPEEKIFCQDGLVTRVQTLKHYPPDATCMIFWLKNRKKQEWRDKVDLEHSGDENKPIHHKHDFSKMSTDELYRHLAETKARR